MTFAALIGRAHPAPLDVDFQLTDLDYKPLAGQPVRLVLGEGQDWQSPGAGNRFVTAVDGKARFTTNVTLDKRWQWDNAGFTPFSVPGRTDHLRIAAELVRTIPPNGNGKDMTLHLLYTMDVYLRKGGDCSTSGFSEMYSADTHGRFMVRVPPGGLPIPNSGGMVLSGQGYQPWNYLLSPANDSSQSWKLKLAFKRNPPPVRR